MCLNMPFNGVFCSNRELNKLVPPVRRGLGARRLRLAAEEPGFIYLLFFEVHVTKERKSSVHYQLLKTAQSLMLGPRLTGREQ